MCVPDKVFQQLLERCIRAEAKSEGMVTFPQIRASFSTELEVMADRRIKTVKPWPEGSHLTTRGKGGL